jgi:hypothetical protein
LDSTFGGESQILGPGRVGYTAPNQMHGFKNVGSMPISYFIYSLDMKWLWNRVDSWFCIRRCASTPLGIRPDRQRSSRELGAGEGGWNSGHKPTPKEHQPFSAGMT